MIAWNAAVGAGGGGGEVSELITRAAGVFALPGVGFVALTLALAMLLAWGAAAVGGVKKGRGVS